MEKIKKIIKLGYTLEKTKNGYLFIPNQNTEYNIKILLKEENPNFGLFNNYKEEETSTTTEE